MSSGFFRPLLEGYSEVFRQERQGPQVPGPRFMQREVHEREVA